MSQTKVQPTHLERQAVIYIRQSSPQQVRQNTEGRQRQYQLSEQAQALGWSAPQVVIIDDDLGISGARSHNRSGYQRLVSMLALREVGILFGIEVSRLARNNRDWHELLELAAVFDVLIADQDGIYDLSDFNDRLLLGLKGTISEVELHQIRARTVRARLSKAARGELRMKLPVGLDWDASTGKPRLAVDESVRHSIAMVLHLFRQRRSIRAVLHYFRDQQLELPYQEVDRERGRTLHWRPATYDALYAIVTNPSYAGAYCYGKRERCCDPLAQTTHQRKKPRSEWEVFLPDHHPGYIPMSEFEENQRILANNRQSFPANQGAPRCGSALLQGLVFCAHCGHKMRVRYSRGEPSYICDADHKRYGTPICNRANARRVDDQVAELFLTVVNANTLELSLSHADQLDQEASLLDRAGQEKLQRLQYQAAQARRRYENVEPENRLVARTLETEWNQALVTLETAQKEYAAQQPQNYQRRSTLEQMQQVIAALPHYWYADRCSNQDKKTWLRCLIEQVDLEQHLENKIIHARVLWYGGAVSELDVPKYLVSAPHSYRRIGELALDHTDAEIAERLNQEQITTVTGKPWSGRRVMDFRLSNAIASGFTTHAPLRIPTSGYLTCAEAAQQLGVNPTTVQKWYRSGVLSGKQDTRQSPLWIRWSEDLAQRLGGGATPDPGMVSLRSLCQQRRQKPDAILRWAQSQGHAIYRLRRGAVLRFYILPQDPAASEKVPEGNWS